MPWSFLLRKTTGTYKGKALGTKSNYRARFFLSSSFVFFGILLVILLREFLHFLWYWAFYVKKALFSGANTARHKNRLLKNLYSSADVAFSNRLRLKTHREENWEITGWAHSKRLAQNLHPAKSLVIKLILCLYFFGCNDVRLNHIKLSFL